MARDSRACTFRACARSSSQRERWRLTGDGDFTGTFHLFKGGRELKGTFASAEAGVNDYRFQALRGSLVWLPQKFEVTDATSRVYGGDGAVRVPDGADRHRRRRRKAIFDATYRDVDLGATSPTASRSRASDLPAARRGAAGWSGRSAGSLPGVRGGGRSRRAAARGRARARPHRAERADERGGAARQGVGTVRSPPPDRARPDRCGAHLHVRSRVGEHRAPAASRRARPTSSSRAAPRGASSRTIPFHVTSADWLESDRLLAGIMTAFGSDTGAVDVGGWGEFDGVMTEAFRAPRVEGHFSGERMRAWDVVWGDGAADIVIENGYVTVENSAIRSGASVIEADGRFSLGYPRKDGGEEINARVRLDRPADRRPAPRVPARRLPGGRPALGRVPPVRQVRDAVRLRQDADRPTASLTRSRSRRATASLRFEGAGVRLDAIEARRAAGRSPGAAYVGVGRAPTRSTSPGRRVPVETMAALRVPAGAALRAARLHGRRAAAGSRSRDTTSGSASATSSSATRASAR